jgi:hypothetical protein
MFVASLIFQNYEFCLVSPKRNGRAEIIEDNLLLLFITNCYLHCMKHKKVSSELDLSFCF